MITSYYVFTDLPAFSLAGVDSILLRMYHYP